MADNFDRESSDLLCEESPNTCFDVLDYNSINLGSSPSVTEQEDRVHMPVQSLNHNRSKFLRDLAFQSEEIVIAKFSRENYYFPRGDYLNRLRSGDLDLSVRKDAIDWICKAHAHCGFGPLSICLSINYLDRFLSIYDLPRGKVWAAQLLAVACLSIAAKLEETNVPQCVDLQVGDPKFLFEAKTIQRMELVVLTTLKWRMQALTPLAFVDYFVCKISNDKHASMSFVCRSTKFILSIIKGIDFLEFKPSEIAAAVAISVTGKTLAVDIDKTMSCFIVLEKGRVLKCVERMKDLIVMAENECTNGASGSATPPMPQSPIGVLDAACLSTRSDALVLGSFANSSSLCKLESKKRKHSDYSQGE